LGSATASLTMVVLGVSSSIRRTPDGRSGAAWWPSWGRRAPPKRSDVLAHTFLPSLRHFLLCVAGVYVQHGLLHAAPTDAAFDVYQVRGVQRAGLCQGRVRLRSTLSTAQCEAERFPAIAFGLAAEVASPPPFSAPINTRSRAEQHSRLGRSVREPTKLSETVKLGSRSNVVRAPALQVGLGGETTRTRA
jgi:hypothetical protein